MKTKNSLPICEEIFIKKFRHCEKHSNWRILSGSVRTFVVISIILFNIRIVKATTYKTIANGNWMSSSTWTGGSIPPSTQPSGDSIIIRHTVAYNNTNNIEINGVYWIEPLTSTTAGLTVPSGKNIEINASGRLIIKNAVFLQRRFTSGNDGQPYSGNNPGASLQSGNFTNRGYINILNSYIEVAQNWISESGGKRIFRNGCLFAGQNYSLTGSSSSDTLESVTISLGWHGSGNFEVSDATMYLDDTRIQIAGTSGHFKLNSGNVNGDIDYIALRNQIVPFTGSGNIEVSSSVNNSPSLNLDAYCAGSSSNLIHNSKFSGSRTLTCGLNYFPGNCTGVALVPLDLNEIEFNVSKRGSNHILLDWRVLNDMSNNYYVIERSNDGESWTILKNIKVQDNFTTNKHYQFFDESPLNGKNYYRIKSIDLKGQIDFSTVQMVNNQTRFSEISIFPNPGSAKVNLSSNYFFQDLENVEVYLLNIEGNETPLEFNLSNGLLEFDVSDVPSGYYFIKVKMMDEYYITTLAIVH